MEKPKDDTTETTAPMIRSSQLTRSSHISRSSNISRSTAGSLTPSWRSSSVQKLETAAATITFTTGDDDDDDDSEESDSELEESFKKERDISGVSSQPMVLTRQQCDESSPKSDKKNHGSSFTADVDQCSQALPRSAGAITGSAEAIVSGSQEEQPILQRKEQDANEDGANTDNHRRKTVEGLDTDSHIDQMKTDSSQPAEQNNSTIADNACKHVPQPQDKVPRDEGSGQFVAQVTVDQGPACQEEYAPSPGTCDTGATSDTLTSDMSDPSHVTGVERCGTLLEPTLMHSTENSHKSIEQSERYQGALSEHEKDIQTNNSTRILESDINRPHNKNITEKSEVFIENKSVNFDEQWGSGLDACLPSPSHRDSAFTAIGEDPETTAPKQRTDSTYLEDGLLESGLPSSRPQISGQDHVMQAQNFTENSVTPSSRLPGSSSQEQGQSGQETSVRERPIDGEENDDKVNKNMRPERFNPFDRDIVVDEDHFDNEEEEIERRYASYERERVNSSFTSAGSGRQSQEDSEDDITFAELGLAEDHFSQPEGHFGLSTLEELELTIEQVKDMVMKASSVEKKKNLVKKLVQLRLKLSEAQDTPDIQPDVKTVLGHTFKHKTQTSSKTNYCERCNRVIWGLMQARYKCTGCGYQCHERCINLILRQCAKQKVSDNPVYQLNICPERGLSAQGYRCAECRVQIAYTNKGPRGQSEPRKCDYSGLFYCALCHWNDSVVIPARVLHNWDFEPRKVCRSSKQYLRLMLQRAVLRIQDINPMLFSFVEELNEVKKLREEILIMKKYFLVCEDALKSRLLLQLQERQHFVESSDMYSLQDLVDIAEDKLLPQLAKIHTSFAQHIKVDCQRCKVKGFICEICKEDEVLFPFDNIATVCANCSTVLHRHCLQRKNNQCPKCLRLSRRAVDSVQLDQSM
ncbi:uncharacterized protein LOC106172933 [Lingula anatina]|uniref:Uncharacterized protein LOC106172933 n=1 Tax=Lingula anatina TaxID=7574 RepID=A0A1S3JG00_LINAN|nr:uncharacterized protein LOC106172933 [Lingula anatina]XP_013409337.1 uncharacterized protein LOC106172933 [Lingula anatina]XP_013409346.1 uncharacterized protein LOC106172933 [Lingula anatina]|eukprot:XP_013409327.1 uncharacterized protein LOC106172933 [Lingula anatina]